MRAQVLLREANAVTDNPLVFAATDGRACVSGGNFHAEPVALAADALALAIAEIGAHLRAPHRDADRRRRVAACRRS